MIQLPILAVAPQRRIRVRGAGEYLEKLLDGDPGAWGMLIYLVAGVAALIACLLLVRSRNERRLESETWRMGAGKALIRHGLRLGRQKPGEIAVSVIGLATILCGPVLIPGVPRMMGLGEPPDGFGILVWACFLAALAFAAFQVRKGRRMSLEGDHPLFRIVEDAPETVTRVRWFAHSVHRQRFVDFHVVAAEGEEFDLQLPEAHAKCLIKALPQVFPVAALGDGVASGQAATSC